MPGTGDQGAEDGSSPFDEEDDRSPGEPAGDGRALGFDDDGFDDDDGEAPDGEGGEATDAEGGDDEPVEDDLGDLDFGHAQQELGARVCAICTGSLIGEYYDVDGHEACSACARKIVYGEPGDSRAARVSRSLGLGLGAAVLGALIWYGIRAATGYEIGLIAIAVGFGVGFGVKAGSRNIGGRFYQVLAMALTYLAIVSTYVPDLTEAMMTPPDAAAQADPFAAESPTSADEAPPPNEPLPLAVALIMALIVAPFAPFLMGFENIIGLALIAFALWEAWRINRKPFKNVRGPLQLGRE